MIIVFKWDNRYNLFPSNYPCNFISSFFFLFQKILFEFEFFTTDSDTFEREMQMGWGLATFLTLCELGSTLSFIYAREWRASG